MRPVRIFFTKLGEAAYISHLDLQRVMARAMRKSGLPVWYSMGFNPHIYMSFALPLPILVQSVCESVDCKTEAEEFDFAAFALPLSEALPAGIEVSALAPPVHDAGSITAARYAFSFPDAAQMAAAAAAFNTAESVPVLRKTKRGESILDLKTVLPALEMPKEGQGAAEALLPAGAQGTVSPLLLAGWLEQAAGLPGGSIDILRKAIYVRDEPFR